MLLRIAFICLSILTLAGCSSGESNVESGNRLGVFHFGNGTEPQGLDPHVVTGVPEHHIITALFEGLVVKNPYTLELEPGVADSWTISDDGRVYNFHIRENAVWSDGVPITAEDFRWSWWRALHPAMGNLYNYMLFPIVNAEAFSTGQIEDFEQVGVRVIDNRNLEVRLAEPTPYFLQLLDHYSMFPVPRHVIERHGEAISQFTPWTRVENIVGNGAFKLAEWNLNRDLRVERNELYWDIDAVKLNAIIFYPIDNVTTEERMFRSGQLHITNETPPEKIPVYRRDNPEVLHAATYLGTYFYRFNTRREPLDDARVRNALTMAINRKQMIDAVLSGLNEPAFAITPPGTLGYQPPKTFEFDPEKARELLAEAGFPDGEGFPDFEILYNTNEAHQKVAEVIQQMWKTNLNIDVTLVNQEWKVYLDTVNELQYDIARASWIGDYVDPNSFLDMWITDGGNNRTGWSDPAYDRMILQDAPKAQNQEERFAIFYEAEMRLLDSMPILPIYTYSTKHLIDPSVKGLPDNIMDYYNYKYVWLEE